MLTNISNLLLYQTRYQCSLLSNRLLDELHELLGTSDYVCSVLPSTSDTRGLLSGEVFKHCSSKVNNINPSILFISDSTEVSIH